MKMNAEELDGLCHVTQGGRRILGTPQLTSLWVRVLTLDGSVPADLCPGLGTPVIGMN